MQVRRYSPAPSGRFLLGLAAALLALQSRPTVLALADEPSSENYHPIPALLSKAVLRPSVSLRDRRADQTSAPNSEAAGDPFPAPSRPALQAAGDPFPAPRGGESVQGLVAAPMNVAGATPPLADGSSKPLAAPPRRSRPSQSKTGILDDWMNALRSRRSSAAGSPPPENIVWRKTSEVPTGPRSAMARQTRKDPDDPTPTQVPTGVSGLVIVQNSTVAPTDVVVRQQVVTPQSIRRDDAPRRRSASVPIESQAARTQAWFAPSSAATFAYAPIVAGPKVPAAAPSSPTPSPTPQLAAKEATATTANEAPANGAGTSQIVRTTRLFPTPTPVVEVRAATNSRSPPPAEAANSAAQPNGPTLIANEMATVQVGGTAQQAAAAPVEPSGVRPLAGANGPTKIAKAPSAIRIVQPSPTTAQPVSPAKTATPVSTQLVRTQFSVPPAPSAAPPAGVVPMPSGGPAPGLGATPEPAPLQGSSPLPSNPAPPAGTTGPAISGGAVLLPTQTPIPVAAPRAAPQETGLEYSGCASCRGGVLWHASAADAGGAAESGFCDGGGCLPGVKPCADYDHCSIAGRLFGGFYECLCCPDPCYDPHWTAAADSAFFLDAARPVPGQRYRWERGIDMNLPDRSEYFWARADGKGKGPKPPAGVLGERRLDYHELSVYTESVVGNVGAFVDMPYRSLRPELFPQAVGFSDMHIGTKTLLFDCELLQIGLQMRTTVPTGNFSKGLGTGHVSLEPSLLATLKLTEDCYYQGQLGEWIPLGGTSTYQGAILRFNNSVNKVLYRPTSNIQLIGNLEQAGWTFQTGSYTDPNIPGPQRSSGRTYLSLGTGLRLVVCEKYDVGLGSMYSLTEQHWAREMYHLDFRIRF